MSAGVESPVEMSPEPTDHLGQVVKPQPDFRYKCTECPYQSNNKTYFVKHSDVHGNIRPFKCEFCDKTFRDTNQLTNHVNTHSGTKPFQCDQCDAKFSTRGEVTRHVKYKHSFVKPHKCDQCDYSTVELSKLKRHVRMHTGERPYLCQYCDYASSDTFKLKRHLRIHTGERPYECPVCHSRFNQSNSLKYHLTMMHADAAVAGKAQAPSDKENSADLDAAGNDHSPGGSSSSNSSDRTASSCGGGQSVSSAEPPPPTSESMIKSMLSGVDEFNKAAVKYEVFACAKCGVKFTTQELLDEHTVRHTGERPYKCDICGISFGKKFAMRAHMQSHEAAKRPPTMMMTTANTAQMAPVMVKQAFAPGTFISSGPNGLSGFVFPTTAQPNFQIQAQQFAPNSFILLNNQQANFTSVTSNTHLRPVMTGLPHFCQDEAAKSKSKLISTILMNPPAPPPTADQAARSHQTIRSILGINTRDSALVSSLPPLPKSMTSKPADEDDEDDGEYDDPLYRASGELTKSSPVASDEAKAQRKRADDAAKYTVSKGPSPSAAVKKPPSIKAANLLKLRSLSDSCLRRPGSEEAHPGGDRSTIDESIDNAVMKSIEAMKASPSKLGLTSANLVPFKRGKRKFSQQMLDNTFVIPRENASSSTSLDDKLKEAVDEETQDTSTEKVKKETAEGEEVSEDEEEVPVDKELKALIKAKKEASFLSVVLLCSFCQQTFSNKAARNRHVKQVHSKKSVSLQNLTYNDRDSLVSHLDAAATSMTTSYMNGSGGPKS